jgi:UDPglucose 6-dehydrogenase
LRIAIIGSGIVGQATGMGLAFNGNRVIFYDIDRSKLLALRSNGYDVTDNLVNAVNGSDVLFICVPTPTVEGRIDLRHINDCTQTIAKVLEKSKKYVVVVFRSTIPPQTTRTKLIPCIEDISTLKAGADFGVCMNPEFLREQSPLKDFLNPSRIVVGALDDKSGNLLRKIYSPFNCPLIFTDLDTAEMIKYTSNLFLAAKISFFNEIYLICRKLGLDSSTIANTVALDPRIGSYGIAGGKPFGGMCLPKDLAAFIDFAKSKGLNPTLLKAVAEVNQEISFHCSINQELTVRTEQSC